MDVTIKVTGLREAQKALYAYSQQLGDRVVIASLRRGAAVMLKQARANAPKRTGALRRALVVKKSKIHNGKRSTGTLGLYLSIRKGKGRKDPRDAFYGSIIEGDWTSRGGRKIAGKRFVQRAYTAQRENSARLIVQSAIRGAEIVARRTGLK
jgi:hypothetical protein